MGLTFCERCGNIMVLRRKFSRLGEYACRSCGCAKKIPLERIEIKEEMRPIPLRPATIFDKREWI